jgi:hypothetical protein
VGWSVGSPTLSAPNNGNWCSLGAEHPNGIMFVNEPLFTYNQFTGEHIPWIAESYDYNDDFTAVTVKLREGVTWSDGERFDAEDVAYTLNMLLENGKTKKDLRKSIDVANQLTGAEVLDPLTVRIDLVKPDPRYVYRQLTNYFGHGLVWLPEHVWSEVENHADFTFLDLEKGWPVGTGAWKLVRNTPNEIVLDRRDDWWGGHDRGHGAAGAGADHQHPRPGRRAQRAARRRQPAPFDLRHLLAVADAVDPRPEREHHHLRRTRAALRLHGLVAALALLQPHGRGLAVPRHRCAQGGDARDRPRADHRVRVGRRQ